jgi:hypothetical protein
MNADERRWNHLAVIAGLDPAIHLTAARWMPASRAGMTAKEPYAFICVHLRFNS